MKSNYDQIIKAQNLLAQALSCARSSLDNNPSLIEAKNHMHQAVTKLNKYSKKVQMQKMQEQNKNTTPFVPVAQSQVTPFVDSKIVQEAFQRSLNEIDRMIKSEQDKIDKINQKSSNNELMNE